jgi:hypothetical protein
MQPAMYIEAVPHRRAKSAGDFIKPSLVQSVQGVEGLQMTTLLARVLHRHHQAGGRTMLTGARDSVPSRTPGSTNDAMQ